MTHKLLLGSDFPSGTIDNVIDGLRRVNEPVEGTRLPHIPDDVIEADHPRELEGSVPGVGLTIASVEAIPVRAPRTKPMISAGGGAPLRVSDFGIVRIRTSDGIEGLGEISMNGGRTGAIQCDDVNRLIGPAIVGQDPTQLRALVVLMDRTLDGSEPAKAGVEMALVDIVGQGPRPARVRDARRRGPRARADPLGPRVRATPMTASRRPPSGSAKGVRTIKIKIGRPGHRPGRGDGAGHPRGTGRGIDVMVDANSGYRTPQDAASRSSVGWRRTTSSSSSSRCTGGTSPAWRRSARASARRSSPTSRCATGPRPTTSLAPRPPTSWPSTSARRAGCWRRQKAAAIGEAAGLPGHDRQPVRAGHRHRGHGPRRGVAAQPGLRVRHHRPPALPGGHHQRAPRLRRRRDPTARTRPASA